LVFPFLPSSPLPLLPLADSCGSGETLAFELISGTEYFELVTVGNDVELKTRSGGSDLDYEMVPSSGISFTVRARDSASNVYDQTLTIYVTDIAEPPQAYDLVCTFEENTPDGRIAGLVSAGARSGEICMIQADASGDEEVRMDKIKKVARQQLSRRRGAEERRDP
jgi:hypothetical protein